MAPPQVSEDEAEDLLYFARAGETEELAETLAAVVARATEPAGAALAVLAVAQDGGKNTSLHMAAGNGHAAVVTYLLDQVADAPTAARQAFVDAVNEYGNTALHWAAMNGHLAVVQLLVARGASQALANDKNYVPLDLASFNEKLDVVDYFLKTAGVREAENGEGGLSSAAEAMGLKAEEGVEEADVDKVNVKEKNQV